MNTILEKLFSAADNHGSDLQDMLRRSWELMTVSQRLALLRSEEVGTVIEVGASGDFEKEDLVAEITNTLAGQEAEIAKAGYEIIHIERELEGWHFWKVNKEEGNTFGTHEDAVTDAYQHFIKTGSVGDRAVDAQHVKNAEFGGLCPVCGSESIEGYSVEVVGSFAFQECGCNECDSTWKDKYRLIGLSCLKVGDDE